MLIVLARATDEQVAMHLRASGAFGSTKFNCGLEIQNASLVTVSRARDGARSQTTAHTQHSSGCPKESRSAVASVTPHERRDLRRQADAGGGVAQGRPRVLGEGQP